MSLREEANSYKRMMAKVRAKALEDAEVAVREALGHFCRDRDAFVLSGPAGMAAAGVAAVRALAVPEQEGASEVEEQGRSAVIRASEHTSPNAREAALRIAGGWQRSLHPGTSDYFEAQDAITVARAYLALLSTSSGEQDG